MTTQYLTEYGKGVVLVAFALAVLVWVLFFAPDPVTQVNLSLWANIREGKVHIHRNPKRKVA